MRLSYKLFGISTSFFPSFIAAESLNKVLRGQEKDIHSATRNERHEKTHLSLSINGAVQNLCGVDNPNWIADGYCDSGKYNTKDCGWDGGDCCETTCMNGDYTCGYNGYDCKNLQATSKDGLRVSHISFSSTFFMIWQDRGSGGNRDVGLWRPALPPLHFIVGFLAVRGYGKPNLDELITAHYSTPPTSAQAASSFQYVYRDSGTGANIDVSIARPVCPEGYYSLSDVPMMGHCYDHDSCTNKAMEQYPPDVYRPCIKDSLLKQCSSLPDVMWDDRQTGGDIDQTFQGINSGGFPELGNGDGHSYIPCFFRSVYGYGRTNDPAHLKCLDREKLVHINFIPSTLSSEELALKFAPQLRFDRDTSDYPISAADFYEGAIKPNQGTSFRSIKDMDRIRMYYFIDRCKSGATIRIVYLWFFGFQPMCEGDPTGGSQHHADWERIEILVEANADSARPIKEVTYHQHGDFYTANIVPIVEESDGAHPVVYVGRDSHGSYHFESDDTPGINNALTCLQFDDPRRPNPTSTYFNSWERPSQFTNVEDPQTEEKDWIEADKAASFKEWAVSGDDNIGGISSHPMKELLDSEYEKYDGSCPGKTCKGSSCDWEDFFQCKDGVTTESFFNDVENVFQCESNRWEQFALGVGKEGADYVEDWLINQYDTASNFFNNEFKKRLEQIEKWFGGAGDTIKKLFGWS